MKLSRVLLTTPSVVLQRHYRISKTLGVHATLNLELHHVVIVVRTAARPSVMVLPAASPRLWKVIDGSRAILTGS